MPYPPRYLPQTDFALVEQEGRELSGTALSTELVNISETLLQLIAFVRAGFTSDKRWSPASAVSQEMVQSEEFTATAGQDQFPLPGGLQANPASDFARVYVNGVRLAPSEATLVPDDPNVPGVATQVTLATALAGGETVIVELINDYATLREQLASNLNAVGASLVGIEDALGRFAATNVEDALAELVVRHDALLAALGDLSKYAKIDGSRAWEADQSMGGFRLTNLADGQDQQDAVTVAQLAQLAAVFGDLSQVFLQLTGDEPMQGNLDMGGNFVINVRPGTQPSHAVNLQQLNDSLSATGQQFLPLSGGDMTGAMTVLPPVDPGNPVRLDFFQSEVDILRAQVDALGTGTGGDGDILLAPRQSVEIDGVGLGSPIPDFSQGGVFHFEGDLTVVANQAPENNLVVHVTGNAVINGDIITGQGRNIEINAGGDITISGTLRAGDLLNSQYGSNNVILRAGGDIAWADPSATIRGRDVILSAQRDILMSGGVFARGFAHIAALRDVVRTGGMVIAFGPANDGPYTSAGNGDDSARGGGAGALGGRGGDGSGSGTGAPASRYRGHNAILSRAARETGGRGGGGGVASNDPRALGGGAVWVFAGRSYSGNEHEIRADGAAGQTTTVTGPAGLSYTVTGGGGGGGMIVVVAVSDIEGANAFARGGNGSTNSGDLVKGGGGGGGGVFFIAQSVSSSSADVSGGNALPPRNGGTGTYEILELSSDQLNGLRALGSLLP